MHVEDAIGSEQYVTLQVNWLYIPSRNKQIQQCRTDLRGFRPNSD